MAHPNFYKTACDGPIGCMPDYQCSADQLSNETALYASTAILPLCPFNDFVKMEGVLRGVDTDNPIPSTAQMLINPHARVDVCPIATGQPPCIHPQSSLDCYGNRDLKELPHLNRDEPQYYPHVVVYPPRFSTDSRERDEVNW